MPRITRPEKRWFDWEDDPDNSSARFKNLSPGELDEINDGSFKKDFKYNKIEKGRPEQEVEVKIEPDLKAIRELPIVKSVIDWKNFFDADGKILKCTPENVERAIREIEGFKEWAEKCRKKLAKDIAKEKEDQAKNSNGSASKPAK